MTKTQIAEQIATVGPVGYAPKAPGTFGSIPGLILGMFFGLLASSGIISYFSVFVSQYGKERD